MRTTSRYLILAGAGLALLAAAAAAPVLAHNWHGRGGPGMMGLIDTYDADGDDRLTQAEIDTARQQQLARFDGDGNGRLSLAEYQGLWAEAMRERMVRQFQGHDSDGDPGVTLEEFQARFADVVQDRDGNGDGALTADELRRHGRGGPRGDGDRERGGPERD